MRITGYEPEETRTETSVAASAGATSLAVVDASDFEAPGWVRVDNLQTGAQAQYAFSAVDVDGGVLTLPAGASLSAAVPAGSAVVAVSSTGIPLVDWYADVSDGDGADRVRISAPDVRALRNDLVGAACEVSDGWVTGVFDVPERTVTPYYRAVMEAASYSIPNGAETATGSKIPQTWTAVPFVGTFNGGVGITYDGITGNAKVDRDGTYRVDARAVFTQNATGARMIRVVWVTYIGEFASEWMLATPSSTYWPAHVSLTLQNRLAAGEGFRVEVWQNSGAALPLLGGYSPPRTTLGVVYVGP